jgi:uncharacterized repeat protein (TIGR01451 family)
MKTTIYTAALLVLLASFIGTPVLANDSAETLAEQALALDAQANPRASTLPGQTFGGAAGPLLVGVDDTAVGAFRVDVVGDIATLAFTGAGVWGAAYDEANDRVLFNSGTELLEWPVGGAVNSLGTITDAGMAALSMTGLAFGNDTLYACRNIANEAIYEIDLNTLVATVFIDYVDADFDCGGLAFNPDDGFLYMTNDDTTPFGSGLFRMNLDGTGTLITPYPPGETDIDGLAIGDGRAYLLIDEPGDLYVWDFALAAYQTPLTSPFTTSETFSGGTWIGAAGPVADLYINEVMYNPPGADGPNEYIEFRGAPSAVIPAGTYLVEIEGDGAGAGVVDRVFDLSGRTLGSNGYMVFLQQGNTYVVDPMATVATATGTGWTGLGGPNDIENGTVSFLLISSPAAPVIGTDVDADNDGVLDGVALTWTIIDSVAATDGGGADLNYAPRPCDPIGFTPGVLARIGESTGSTAADWVCAQVVGTVPNFVLSDTNVAPPEFADRALDHIGSFNFPPLGGGDADLSVTLADAPDPVNAGANLSYTVTATNNGPADADNASITLPLPAGTSFVSVNGGAGATCNAASPVTCTWAGPTANGASRVAVIVAAVAPATTGTLNTTVTVASDTNDPNLANNSASATTGVNVVADLAISKTNGVAASTPGTNTVYTIVASNAGPSNAPGSTVTDSFPAACVGVTWTCAGAGGGTCTANGAGNINDVVNLPAGGSVSYSATCPIDPAAVGLLANTATITAAGGVTDPAPANNSATDTDTLTPAADLAITKTNGVASSIPGTSTTYTIVASNAGPSDAPGSTVADTFPAACVGVTWTCAGAAGGTCTANGAGNINDVVNLPAGGSVSYSATCPIDPAALGTLDNTATVAVAGGVTDPNGANNSATDSDTLGASADLSITKVAVGVPTPLLVGSTFSYTLTASNAGPSTATAVVVTDVLPATLDLVSTDCGAAYADPTLTWNIGTLAPGANAVCNLSVVVAELGPIVNTATIASATADPNGANNASTSTLTGAELTDMSISLSANVMGNLAVGDSYVYTVTGTNNGPGVAFAIDFTLELSSKVSFVSSTCGAVLDGTTLSWTVATLASGAAASCQITVVVVLPGDIQATANVSSITLDPDLSNNSADLVVGTGAIPVPAFSTLGLLLLSLLLGGLGVAVIRR